MDIRPLKNNKRGKKEAFNINTTPKKAIIKLFN